MMRQPMLCAYCLDRLTWPDDFPNHLYACCGPCGVRLGWWGTDHIGASSDPAENTPQGQL